MGRDGSVYRDGNRWRAALDVGIQGGKRVRRKIGVTIPNPDDEGSVEAARVECERRLAQLRADYAAPATSATTVGQALALWLDEVAQRVRDGEREISTLENYERLVRRLIMPGLGRRPLSAVMPMDVVAWDRQLARSGVSKSQRAKALQALKTGLRWCQRMGIVDLNPAEPVDPPSTAGESGRAASLAEIKQLLETPGRYRHLYTVLTGLCLRIGEGLGIAVSDYDLDSTPRTILIGAQLVRERPSPDVVEKAWVRKLPKDKEARRIPVPGFVADAVREQEFIQAAMRSQHEALGGTWQDPWGLLFTGPDGSPLHATSVNRSLKRTCKDLGIGHLSPHDLRRSGNSLLTSRGVGAPP